MPQVQTFRAPDMSRCEEDEESCDDGISAGKRESSGLLKTRVRSLTETLSEAPSIGRGTVAGTVFNILSNVVGGGILALPYAFANTGFVLGSILVVFVGVMSGYAMWALMYCAEQLDRRGTPEAFSYKAMMINAYGPRMGKVVEAVIIWYTFGTCVTYGVVTGQSLSPLAKDWLNLDGFMGGKPAWTIFAGVLFAVCSCARTLAELKFTSFLAFVTIMYVLLCVIVRTFAPWDHRDKIADSATAFNWSTDIFRAIPLMSVSYGCHYNIPVYYQELTDRSPEKFTRILKIALSVIMFTYLLMSWFGYLHFGSGTPSYILQTGSDDDDGSSSSGSGFRFSIDDNMVNAARLGMFVHFAFVFPLIAIACRRSINLFLNIDLSKVPWIILIFQSLAIVAAAVFLACLIPNIGVVLDFNGSLFGVFLIITFPGLLLIKLNPTFADEDKVNPVLPWILLVMGLLFTVCGFVMTTLSVAKGDAD